MVELKGTEKQIKWANDIREMLMDYLKEVKSVKKINDYADSIIEGGVDTLKSALCKVDDSVFFIDLRKLCDKELFMKFENDENTGVFVLNSSLGRYFIDKTQLEIVEKHKSDEDETILKEKCRKLRKDYRESKSKKTTLKIDFKSYV